MLDNEYNIKLGDFGLSTMASEDLLMTSIIETKQYLASKIIAIENYNIFWCDIFSYDVIIFELIGGFSSSFSATVWMMCFIS